MPHLLVPLALLQRTETPSSRCCHIHGAHLMKLATDNAALQARNPKPGNNNCRLLCIFQATSFSILCYQRSLATDCHKNWQRVKELHGCGLWLDLHWQHFVESAYNAMTRAECYGQWKRKGYHKITLKGVALSFQQALLCFQSFFVLFKIKNCRFRIWETLNEINRIYSISNVDSNMYYVILLIW